MKRFTQILFLTFSLGFLGLPAFAQEVVSPSSPPPSGARHPGIIIGYRHRRIARRHWRRYHRRQERREERRERRP
jgi:hypothetical protein